MTKHFKAVHRTTGETIEFGLGDIWFSCGAYGDSSTYIGEHETEHGNIGNWLKDYNLEYKHEGQWYPYKQGGGE